MVRIQQANLPSFTHDMRNRSHPKNFGQEHRNYIVNGFPLMFDFAFCLNVIDAMFLVQLIHLHNKGGRPRKVRLVSMVLMCLLET
jgi:hypothetical protein